VRWRGRAGGPIRAANPKEGSDEHATAIGEPHALGELYEALRERALGAAADGFRHGLGLLLTRGVAAWMQAAHQLTPAVRETDNHRCGDALDGQERELVRVLAGMALACVER
jgi:hypothetical protein